MRDLIIHFKYFQHIIHLSEEKFEQLKTEILRIQEKKPIVSADHLQKTGIKPGKQMGELLQKAEKISINEQLTDPDIILKKLFLNKKS